MLVLLAILAAIFFLPSPWGLVAILAALVVDLAEVAFGLWYAKRRKPQTGTEALVGSVGTVTVRCNRSGRCGSRVSSGRRGPTRAPRPGRTSAWSPSARISF